MIPSTQHDKFWGSLLGGALGDALGAPAEGLRTLAAVRSAFGSQGLTGLVAYSCPWQGVEQSGVGAITDDTTMAAVTLAAMVAAQAQPNRLHHLSWQGYLRWGTRQEGGEQLSHHFDRSVSLPDEVKPFWFGCGAGRGTIAALSAGRMGTMADPLDYDMEVRGKRVTGPNDGCGGMMRVAPLAFWPYAADKFRLGAENGAITHGAPSAYLATGAVCYMVEQAALGHSLAEVFTRTASRLAQEPQGASLLSACQQAWQAAIRGYSAEGVDELPTQYGHTNLFRATPVMMQTVYALSAAHHHTLDLPQTLCLAVNHGGDSDSVGAIVGNILGASQGEAALPKTWTKQLQMRHELRQLGRLALAA